MIFTIDKYKRFLNKSTEDVDPTSIETAELAEEMLKVVDGVGVGLAANQIGQRKNLAVIQLDKADNEPGKREHMTVCCNPSILIDTSHGPNGQIITQEGCLSIPGEVYLVPRFRYITLFYQDLQGNDQKRYLSNYSAVIAQHELDHLDGKTIHDVGKHCIAVEQNKADDLTEESAS